MTDGSGDWTYRGRYGTGDYGADDHDAGDFGPGDYAAGDPRPDDSFYSGSHPGTGRAERSGYDPDGVPNGWSGEFERPGYGRSGLTERPGDPYYQPGPDGPGRHGQPGGYDDEPGGYGHSSGYGDIGGFGAPSGPDAATGYGRHGQPPNRDDLGGYRAGPDGQGSHAADLPYQDPAYQADDAFGQAGYDSTGSFGRYGHDPHGERPYGDHDSYQPGSDRTSAIEWPGQRSAGGSPPSRSFGRADSGSFGRVDSGPFGADTGSFGRADNGSYSGTDTGAFARGDSGSFGRVDSGPVGSDGYAQWHSDPTEHAGWDNDGGHQDADDDWGDEEAGEGGDPMRGFLRRGGGRGGDEGGGRGGRRSRRPRGRFAMVAAILAGALVLGMVTDFGYEYVHNWITNRYGDYSGEGYGTVHVTVPPGSSLVGLGPMLVSDGVIMSLRPYDSAANAAVNASGLQPGVYVLHNHMSAASAVAALLNPKNRAKDQITIIEGWRASEIATALAKQTGHPASEFTKIIDHPPASLGLPKWAAGKSAEGFLFPDTYTLLPSMTPLQVLQMMVKDFNQRTASLHIETVARAKSVTSYQMLTAASLIQAEGGSTSDFGKISRVIWNRIQQNIKLGFDSTVFYAMGTYGTYLKTYKQEHYPSPYNTYTHFGLPPGPIDSPGAAAIQAALHAPKGSELYFVTDTKTHVTHFTSSYSQFLQWKQEFEG